MKWDWKYIVSTVVAVVGVGASIYVWQAGDPKALTVRTVSKTPLQPTQAAGLEGLKVTVDNNLLTSPWLLVVEIRNTGSRPISAADFESALEVAAGKDSVILRAQVASSAPPDLRPDLKVEGGRARLAPLLLNPDDAITVAAIAERGEPVVQVRARIAGIGAVKLLDDSKDETHPLKVALLFAFSFAAFVAYALAEFIREKKGAVNSSGAWLLQGVCLVAGGFPLLGIFKFVTDGKVGFFVGVTIVAAMIVVATLVSLLLRESKAASGAAPQPPATT